MIMVSKDDSATITFMNMFSKHDDMVLRICRHACAMMLTIEMQIS